MSIQLLVIGDTFRNEARPLSDWIDRTLQPAELKRFKSFDDALAIASQVGWIPDMVIVFQSWTDEYSAGDIERLLALAPLARLTVCYGAWCESDGRNRHAWPLAVRVPMHLARCRLDKEWRLVANKPVPHLLLLSSSREETFLADHAVETYMIDPKHASMRVGIDSPDAEYRRYLVELLKHAGLSASPFVDAHPCDRVLFDADPPGDSRLDRLRQIRATRPDIPIIALASAPSPEIHAVLNTNGVAAVRGKLGDQSQILQCIVNSDHIV